MYLCKTELFDIELFLTLKPYLGELILILKLYLR